MIWLLVLLPLALAAPAVHTTFVCNGEPVSITYSLENGTITLFYTDTLTEDVVKSFIVFIKLRDVIDDLSFLTPETIASLRSLAEACEEYSLQLAQARALAERGGLELNVDELNALNNRLRRLAVISASRAEELRREVLRIVERPGCYTGPDLNGLSVVDELYDVAKELLKRAAEVQTSVVAEENVDPVLLNAIVKLLDPPFSRGEIDMLKARKDSDVEVLRMAFRVEEDEVSYLLELSDRYALSKELNELMEGAIVTSVGTFDGIEEAVKFVLTYRDRLSRGEEAERVRKLYEELRKAVKEGDLAKAVETAKLLRRTLTAVLEAGWEKEEREEPNIDVMPLFFLVILLIGAVVLSRRGRRDEEGVDLGDIVLDDE